VPVHGKGSFILELAATDEPLGLGIDQDTHTLVSLNAPHLARQTVHNACSQGKLNQMRQWQVNNLTLSPVAQEFRLIPGKGTENSGRLVVIRPYRAYAAQTDQL